MSNNIWVVIENAENDLTELSKEMMNKAKAIAKTLNKKLVAVVSGYNEEEICKKSIAYGADLVLNCNHKLLKDYTTLPYTKVFNEIIDKYNPYLVIFPASVNGRDLAGRLCAKNNLGLVAECSDLKLDGEDIKFIRPTFDGKLFSDIRVTTKPMFATIGHGAFSPAKYDNENKGEIIEEKVELTDADILTEILSKIPSQVKKSELIFENAKIIVSGGMGLVESKNWHLIEEFADALGASVGASKPICDLGICSSDFQVGVTGKNVSPDIYIAVGISGAIQHINGIKKSKLIIAINSDPNAPIFQIAHYGIVADLFDILPKLTEKINKEKLLDL